MEIDGLKIGFVISCEKGNGLMIDIEWIIKNRKEIERWYVEQGVFEDIPLGPDDGRAYYESFVTNYVAQHAHKFPSQNLMRIWYELGLRDDGLKEIEKKFILEVEIDGKIWKKKLNWSSQVKPDLLLEFKEDIWLIEVKFSYYSPDIESNKKTKEVKETIKQIRVYETRLRHLIEQLGWFAGKKIHLAIAWAFWWERERDVLKHLDTKYSTWLSDRSDR
jgi:hypothetical protein